MSNLFFSGTQDHALLAMVVQEAHDLPEVRNLGRTALQKIVYFLKALAVPMRYRFEIHHYGPYSEQIASDIELLIADEVIADRPANPNYSNYQPDTQAAIEELLAMHGAFSSQHRALIRRVVSVFGRLTPQDLELYATLHYAYRYEMAGGSRPSKDLVIGRFKSYKGEKFPGQQVTVAYEAMVTAGLIQAS